MPKTPPKGPQEPLKNDSPPAPKSVRGKPALDGRPSWAGSPHAVTSPPASIGQVDSRTSTAGPPAAPLSPPSPPEQAGGEESAPPPAASPPPSPPPDAMTEATPPPPPPPVPPAALAEAVPPAADLPPHLQSMVGRFGTPRGPEFRVFPVTKDGRGPKLFSFPKDAYGEDELRAKLARDYGAGEYDVIGFNEKGQTIAGSSGRLYVEDIPAPRQVSGISAPAPTMPARHDEPDFKREFFELLKVVVGRPQAEQKPVNWAAILTAGAGAVTAAGGLVVPLITKAMDRNAPAVAKDPMQALKDAMELGKQVSAMVGGAVGGKTNGYDAVMHALTEGKEMLKQLHEIALIDSANAKPAPQKPQPPRPPAAPAALPAPAPPPAPSAPPASAPPPAPEPDELEYPATPQGLQQLIADHADELLTMADEKKPARIGASYLAVLLHQQEPHLLPVAQRVLALPGLIGLLASKDERIKARQPWFEKLRTHLVEMVADDEEAPA